MSGQVFSYLSLGLLSLVLLAYLLAAWYQQAVGRSWRTSRVLAFSAGIFLLMAAVLPPVNQAAHHDLRIHMVQHLLVGMFAPLCLVLGAPVSLTLRTLPTRAARVLVAMLHADLARALTHPVTALVLNIGGMYLLYLTPLYGMMLGSEALHAWVHLHFLLAGYLFTWAILAGPDPAPRPLPMAWRLFVLFLSMAAHAILGKLMYGYLWPRGTHHSVEEIRSAAQWMYYGGDLAEGLLLCALFASWYLRAPRALRDPRRGVGRGVAVSR